MLNNRVDSVVKASDFMVEEGPETPEFRSALLEAAATAAAGAAQPPADPNGNASLSSVVRSLNNNFARHVGAIEEVDVSRAHNVYDAATPEGGFLAGTRAKGAPHFLGHARTKVEAAALHDFVLSHLWGPCRAQNSVVRGGSSLPYLNYFRGVYKAGSMAAALGLTQMQAQYLDACVASCKGDAESAWKSIQTTLKYVKEIEANQQHQHQYQQQRPAAAPAAQGAVAEGSGARAGPEGAAAEAPGDAAGVGGGAGAAVAAAGGNNAAAAEGGRGFVPPTIKPKGSNPAKRRRVPPKSELEGTTGDAGAAAAARRDAPSRAAIDQRQKEHQQKQLLRQQQAQSSEAAAAQAGELVVDRLSQLRTIAPQHDTLILETYQLVTYLVEVYAGVAHSRELQLREAAAALHKAQEELDSVRSQLGGMQERATEAVRRADAMEFKKEKMERDLKSVREERNKANKELARLTSDSQLRISTLSDCNRDLTASHVHLAQYARSLEAEVAHYRAGGTFAAVQAEGMGPPQAPPGPAGPSGQGMAGTGVASGLQHAGLPFMGASPAGSPGEGVGAAGGQVAMGGQPDRPLDSEQLGSPG